MRIVLTSVGSISAIGVIACLETIRGEVRIIGTNSIAAAAGNFMTDRTVLVPPTADADAWKDAVRRLVLDEEPDLVLNGRDEEIGLLGELSEAGTSPKTRYLVPAPRATDIFNDKYETAAFARRHGLPFADTAFLPDEIESLVARHGLPVVAKPRRNGTGARNVFLATTMEDVRAAQAEGTHVIQEMLASPILEAEIGAWKQRLGIPWAWGIKSVDHEVDLLVDKSVIALCMSAGLAEGALNRDLKLVDEPSMAAAGRAWGAAVAAAGHQGPVNMQGRLLPDGRYLPFELNARFTGTMIGKAHLGRNLVLAALEHWCGVPTRKATMQPGVNSTAQRFPVFIPLDESAVGHLSETGAWHRTGTREGELPGSRTGSRP